MKRFSRTLPEPEEQDAVNPWDAVNALKVDLAAAVAGGAPAETITAIKLQISAAESAAAGS